MGSTLPANGTINYETYSLTSAMHIRGIQANSSYTNYVNLVYTSNTTNGVGVASITGSVTDASSSYYTIVDTVIPL